MTDKLNELAMQMVSHLKSMDESKAMHKFMLQQFINNSLEAEMSEHLGYDKHQKSEQPNKRNGKIENWESINKMAIQKLHNWRHS